MINLAVEQRVEMQVLRLIEYRLCRADSEEELQCYVPWISLMSLSPLPSLCMPARTLIGRLIHNDGFEEQRDALIAIVRSAQSLMRDKISSEVVDAWNQVETTQRRLEIARGRTAQSKAQLEQKQELGAEIGTSA